MKRFRIILETECIDKQVATVLRNRLVAQSPVPCKGCKVQTIRGKRVAKTTNLKLAKGV